MIIAITGKEASGKTLLVSKITDGKNTVYLNPKNTKDSSYWLTSVNHDTEYIVIEDIKDIYQLNDKLFEKRIIVNKKNEKIFEMDTPDIILIFSEGGRSFISEKFGDVMLLETKRPNK